MTNEERMIPGYWRFSAAQLHSTSSKFSESVNDDFGGMRKKAVGSYFEGTASTFAWSNWEKSRQNSVQGSQYPSWDTNRGTPEDEVQVLTT
jgi:hypothetical protein